ncbi:MAG TPA: hypothetical protein VD883_01940, partial [Candidatus Omnitrophota bacterium]|nr:hypothetical protein [Candidatus Omnitrophota bacterium]
GHDRAGFLILKPFIERLDGKRAGVLTESEKMRLLLVIESALPEPVKMRLVSNENRSVSFGPSILAKEAGFMERIDREWARMLDSDDAERQTLLNRLPRLADAVSRTLSGDGVSRTYGAFSIEADRMAIEASAHLRTRFALLDPSYRVALPDLSAETTRARKTIVTDLEVFLKDAGGKPYAYRMERLGRRSRGLFRHVLLVRDPLLTSREELEKKYPETAVFGDRIIFAPGLRDADDVRKVAPDLELDPDTVIVAPDPEALKAGHSAFLSSEKIYVLSLGRGSETSIGALETAALVVSDPDRLPSRVKKSADGMYIYLPPPAPWDYLELLRYAMNAKVLSQSA